MMQKILLSPEVFEELMSALAKSGYARVVSLTAEPPSIWFEINGLIFQMDTGPKTFDPKQPISMIPMKSSFPQNVTTHDAEYADWYGTVVGVQETAEPTIQILEVTSATGVPRWVDTEGADVQIRRIDYAAMKEECEPPCKHPKNN